MCANRPSCGAEVMLTAMVKCSRPSPWTHQCSRSVVHIVCKPWVSYAWKHMHVCKYNVMINILTDV